ncbi:Di-copper centre-containing protein [Ascobolus immersus RN42]|uniref:Di-copper centre-containing protein n=1 Tax=Ascobolus immersus RN42 TaxID=1160509 RepID=A0A3N4HRP6_ASCIM|nr:Di-copper centre-containing protein [Ascobolus immersus RN42]
MVAYRSILASAAALFLAVSAAPTPDVPSTPLIPAACNNPIVRKEWRSLTNTEKANYINAVKCLTTTPSIATSIGGAINRFDDFQGVHATQTPNIHFVGFFLHWHRYMLHAYEQALRNECNYTGAQPYWDWFIDIDSGLPMEQWPIFDAVTGFGGNGPYVEATAEQNPFGLTGRTGGGCVPDGPFTVANNFTVNINKTDVSRSDPRCLTRDFMPTVATTLIQHSVVTELNAKTNFKDFAYRMEGLPSFDYPNVHGGGHFGVGGVLGTFGDSNNSPGDPIFYLHHANVDRLWALWQEQDPSRILSVGGPISPFDYEGDQIDLNFHINLAELGPSRPLYELQYTRGPMMCYRYDQ